jgi:hypothetical protein
MLTLGVGRKCLFCSNTADSKEHLWADWILQSLKHRVPIRQKIGKFPGKEFRGPLTVKCVCESCNSGWMSRLESKAKPIIGPLMHDLSYALDSSQQETVSVWAIKTAMVLEATNRRTRLTCYTQHECEQLRLHSSIPTRSLGWLGRFAASGLVATGTDIWLDIGGVSRAAHGCVTTIVVGHLALQFLTVHFPAKYDGEPLSINVSMARGMTCLLISGQSETPLHGRPSCRLRMAGRDHTFLFAIDGSTARLSDCERSCFLFLDSPTVKSMIITSKLAEDTSGCLHSLTAGPTSVIKNLAFRTLFQL